MFWSVLSCINEFLTYRSSSENSATSSCVYTPKEHPISFKKRFFRDPKTARRAISPRTTRNLLPKCEKKKLLYAILWKNVARTPTLRHQRRSCPKLARFIYTPWGNSDSILAIQILDFAKLWSKQVGFVSLLEKSSKITWKKIISVCFYSARGGVSFWPLPPDQA